MVNFLKWLVLTLACGLIFGVLEHEYQVLTIVGATDKSYICYLLYGLFIMGVWLNLLRCFKKDNNFKRVKWIMELAPVLGILGTAGGMAYTLWLGFQSGLEIGNEESLQTFLNILFQGTAISFLTTIVGLVTTILLSFYVFILKDYSKK